MANLKTDEEVRRFGSRALFLMPSGGRQTVDEIAAVIEGLGNIRSVTMAQAEQIQSDQPQTTEERYFASRDIEHGCCHGASVRDRQDISGFLSFGNYPSMVCECPDLETAERIARLLNEECTRE